MLQMLASREWGEACAATEMIGGNKSASGVLDRVESVHSTYLHGGSSRTLPLAG